MTLTVDGTTSTASVTDLGNGNFSGTIPWANSAGNPSEHTVYAQAQVHITQYGQTQYKTLDSRNGAPGGAGRPADFIVANLQLQSITFTGTGNLTLMQNASTPVPVPQVTWTQGNPPTASTNPAGYVMGSKPRFAFLLPGITGTAQMGLTVTANANPFPGSDPSVTLKDTGSSPIPFTLQNLTSGVFNVDSDAPLLGKVYRYQTFLTNLALWVQFTQTGQSPAPWRQVASYGSPTALSAFFYATLAQPTTPMAQPWVPVLDYACTWAAGTASATSTTTAVTKGEYSNCIYNDGFVAYTNQVLMDGSENFSLGGFLSTLKGQCNDFSDFLVCLSNALGARPLKSQRSASVKDYYMDPSAVPPVYNPACHFWTNPIVGAVGTGQQYQPENVKWSYHQWGNDSTVFDGCVKFNGTVTPADLSLTSYFNQLVNQAQTYQPYVWDVQNPFQPTIAN